MDPPFNFGLGYIVNRWKIKFIASAATGVGFSTGFLDCATEESSWVGLMVLSLCGILAPIRTAYCNYPTIMVPWHTPSLSVLTTRNVVDA